MPVTKLQFGQTICLISKIAQMLVILEESSHLLKKEEVHNYNLHKLLPYLICHYQKSKKQIKNCGTHKLL